jgi:hypothetical protein
MTRLCAVVAIGCALGVVSIGAAEQAAAAAPAKAESRARQAVAPLQVENAFCVRLSRSIAVCLLRHPDAGELHCRSTVVVRGRRVRVIQRNACFEIREVNP